MGYTVAHVATDLRLSLLRALLAARWEYYVRQPVGSFANAFATEASRASEAIPPRGNDIAFSIQAILYIGLALAVSWQATLAAALFGLLIVFGLHRLVRMARRAGARQTALLKSILGQLTDVLYAVKPLKAMARETQIGPLLEHGTQRLHRALQREVLSKEALRALQDPLLIACLGRWAVHRVDALVVVPRRGDYAHHPFWPDLSSLNKAQRQYQRMASRDSAYWSLQDTLQQSDVAREINTGTRQPYLTQAITLQDVSFAYAEKSILDRASCTLPAGEVTLLLGPSGTGKTSTVDLIAGLLRPHSGAVLIDGVPLDTIDLKAWRNTIGYVPQEMLLLHESVFTNVTLGDTALTEADVEVALRAAEAWEFVQSLPDGILTGVGERGARLSGGQRQRIAIARALVHSPQLLILDEATTALDPDSEAAICQTVRRLRGTMTILAISHQPALLDIADHVYRLENGHLRPVDSAASPHSVQKIA